MPDDAEIIEELFEIDSVPEVFKEKELRGDEYLEVLEIALMNHNNHKSWAEALRVVERMKSNFYHRWIASNPVLLGLLGFHSDGFVESEVNNCLKTGVFGLTRKTIRARGVTVDQQDSHPPLFSQYFWSEVESPHCLMRKVSDFEKDLQNNDCRMILAYERALHGMDESPGEEDKKAWREVAVAVWQYISRVPKDWDKVWKWYALNVNILAAIDCIECTSTSVIQDWQGIRQQWRWHCVAVIEFVRKSNVDEKALRTLKRHWLPRFEAAGTWPFYAERKESLEEIDEAKRALSEKLSALDTEVTTLKDSCNELKNEISLLVDTREKLNEELEHLKVERSRLASEVDLFRDKMTNGSWVQRLKTLAQRFGIRWG